MAGLLLTAFLFCMLGSVWAQKQQQLIDPAVMEATPSENQDVPFKGVFATQFQILVVFPIGHISVTGQGHASHLGASTAVTNNQEANLITGEVTATYVLTGANGDTVILEMEFQATNVPGGLTFAGSYAVSGGSGRFAGATGAGSISGQATFTGPTGGVGNFSVAGRISKPHHSH